LPFKLLSGPSQVCFAWYNSSKILKQRAALTLFPRIAEAVKSFRAFVFSDSKVSSLALTSCPWRPYYCMPSVRRKNVYFVAARENPAANLQKAKSKFTRACYYRTEPNDPPTKEPNEVCGRWFRLSIELLRLLFIMYYCITIAPNIRWIVHCAS
jgi:hypothetical protein